MYAASPEPPEPHVRTFRHTHRFWRQGPEGVEIRDLPPGTGLGEVFDEYKEVWNVEILPPQDPRIPRRWLVSRTPTGDRYHYEEAEPPEPPDEDEWRNPRPPRTYLRPEELVWPIRLQDGYTLHLRRLPWEEDPLWASP